MTPPTRDDLVAHTQAERRRLADLLDGLAPADWDAPSLCAGWRVREVVAHLTMPFRTTRLGVLRGVVAAGMSFHRFADQDARTAASVLSSADLVELVRANVTHPWSPPGAGVAGALSHDLVHGLDAAVPLGLPSPPPDRVALVLETVTDRQLRYFGVSLDGHRLVANDADAAVGRGPVRFEMSAVDVLLVVTGRRPLSAVVG